MAQPSVSYKWAKCSLRWISVTGPASVGANWDFRLLSSDISGHLFPDEWVKVGQSADDECNSFQRWTNIGREKGGSGGFLVVSLLTLFSLLLFRRSLLKFLAAAWKTVLQPGIIEVHTNMYTLMNEMCYMRELNLQPCWINHYVAGVWCL